jgi:hypothetical protein
MGAWPRAVGIVAAVAAGVLSFRLLAAGSPLGDAGVAASAPAASAEIQRLVADLGSDSFALRQRATRELLDRGISAREALEQASRDSDAEVRVRARAILATVIEADFLVRLEAFAADYDGSRKQSLPGWKSFAEQFGSSRAARQIFVEMQRAEPQLLEAFAKGDQGIGEVLNQRCHAISQAATHGQREEQVSMGTVATLLLVGASDDVTVDDQPGVQLYSWMIYQPAFQRNARAGPYSAMLKKLLGRWVMKDSAATVQNLLFAATYELKPEAVQLASRVLTAEPEQQATARQYAMLVVGRFGNKQQVPMLEKLFNDASSLGTVQSSVPSKQVELQVRDIALAAALHITKQNLRDYGYLAVQPNATLLFQVTTLFFNEPGQREAALKKWAQWRAEHPEL